MAALQARDRWLTPSPAGPRPVLPDVLHALADPSVTDWWSPGRNVEMERELWLRVMRLQQARGLDIPDWAIRSSAAHIRPLDPAATLLRIDARERVVRHDLKARLEVYCEDAGHEYHHLGLTSADVVENVSQIRVLRSLETLRDRRDLDVGGLITRFTMRGIKGAVGTQQDQLDLLGSIEACQSMDEELAQHYGFARTATSVGQVHPRSQDLDVVSTLCAAVAPRAVGSKRPLFALLSGFQAMVAAYAGDQWNEGDVSTSVVRRIALPGAFLAAELCLQ